jgi:hypothetical protein
MVEKTSKKEDIEYRKVYLNGYNDGLADQKAKIREWLKQYDQKGLDNLPLLKEFEELM